MVGVKKNVTVFTKLSEQGTYKTVKVIYEGALVYEKLSGEFSESGIIRGGTAVIRIFGDGSLCVNTGDKIVVGNFIGDNPPNDAYVAAEISDNRRGNLPHTKIIAKR